MRISHAYGHAIKLIVYADVSSMSAIVYADEAYFTFHRVGKNYKFYNFFFLLANNNLIFF